MRRIAGALLALAAFAAGQERAEERMVSPALPGFEVGSTNSNGPVSMTEEVPRGESVQDWSAMVTTHRMANAPLTPVQFLTAFAAGLNRVCANATVGGPFAVTRAGRQAATLTFDCPVSRATGGRETTTILAIAGSSAMFVKQVAFRPAYGGSRSWASSFLAATKVCDADC
jgi:hypothetical protein